MHLDTVPISNGLSFLFFRRCHKISKQKMAISFFMSVYESACNNPAPTGWVFMKYNTWGLFEKKKSIQKLFNYFKAYWSRDAPTGLTFNNCTLCPHCIYVFCIYLRTNSDLCHLLTYWLVFITEMKSVYSAVRTGSLNKAVCASSL